MGRYWGMAQTTNRASKIDLRIMLKDGSIQNGKFTSGSISWTYGGGVSFVCDCATEEKYLRLIYSIDETSFDYKIKIVVTPSNLGKGEVLYFQCPKTSKYARVLYSSYGFEYFVHRDFYLSTLGRRLYYNSQSTPRLGYNNTLYFNLKNRVDEMAKELFFKKYKKLHYKGVATREMKKYNDLVIRMEDYNQKRLSNLNDWIEKFSA